MDDIKRIKSSDSQWYRKIWSLDVKNHGIFEAAARALKPGGKHFIDICNADYARKHFPMRHWQVGQNALALADFDWDELKSIYNGLVMRLITYYGEYNTSLPGSDDIMQIQVVAERCDGECLVSYEDWQRLLDVSFPR